MEELNHDIVDYIDSIEITTKKETKYIKENDWTLIKEQKFKQDEFDLQNTLVANAVGHAEALYKLAKADLRSDKVKEALDLLLSSVPVHTNRISNYVLNSDYLESDLSKADIKAEMEFQNELNKVGNKIKSKVRTINYGDATETIDIQTFNNVKIPLMMSDMMEQRFPEIKEFLAKKKKK